MSIDVQSAAQEAVERVATPAGAVLVALYAVFGILQTIAVQDLLVHFVDRMVEIMAETDPEQAAQFESEMSTALDEMHLSLGLGTGPALGLLFLGFLGIIVVLAMAIHTTGRAIDEPGDIVPDGLGWTFVNLLAGAIAYGILVTIGTFFLIIPGIVIAVLLMFWPVAVVLDGESFVGAFGSSISLVSDNIVPALGIVLLMIVAYVVQYVLSIVLGFVPGVAGGVLVQVLGGAVWLFTIALLARAYVGAVDDGDQGQADVVDEDWDGNVA